MIRAGLKAGIPVLVGSAGTSGGDPHVDWTVEIVREIAREDDLRFKMAVVRSELTNDTVLRYYRAGRLKDLYPAPEINETVIKNAGRFVGVMGPEPFIAALEQGAQVVIAGRASDTSIYAAVPIRHGLDNGPAWHAAKLLECGAGCVEQRIYPDCMMAWVREDSFSIEPPNPQMRCTPVSCVSHALYENSNPYVLTEPGRVLYTKNARYEPESERRVRVSGSTHEAVKPYTIRLEGAAVAGYRSITIGGVRDPLILRQFDSFLDAALASIRKKVKVSLGLEENQYRLQTRIYGNPGLADPGEIGLIIETLAGTSDEAASIMAIAWHTALHQPIKEWSGLQSQLAFPYSPPGIDTGAVYKYCVNHVLEVDDPLELFRFEYEQL
jgi:hypothetical protein